MTTQNKKKRYAQLIKIKPEKLDYYKELHTKPWACVLEKLKECHIKNYSIHLAPGNQLFAYFEYTGTNFEADLKKIAADPCTQKWWKETDPCQESLSDDGGWLDLDEIFYMK